MKFESSYGVLSCIVDREEYECLDPHGKKRLRTFIDESGIIVSLRYESGMRDAPSESVQRSVFLEETRGRLGIALGESAYWSARLAGRHTAYLPDGRQIRIVLEGKKD